MSPHMKLPRGFTLIEMMITVALIAILAAIALPSYSSQVRKGRRADAESFMMDVVARQQQFLLDRRTYATSVTAAAADNGLGLTLPSSVSAYYTVLSLDVTTGPMGFTLTLRPTGSQQADSCGDLTINQSGTKSASGSGTCW